MKTKIFLIITVCLFSATGIQAYNFIVDGICYKITNTTPHTVAVTTNPSTFGYYKGSLTIPSTVTSSGITYLVTSIDDQVFYACPITSVSIPSTVTSIGLGAFYSCSLLTSINIPSSVASIGTYAFTYCSKLTSLIIPPSVTSIEGYIFGYCTGLTSITIPATVTSIYGYSFYNCTGLLSIHANAATPIDLTNSPTVFYGVNKTNCILYVPKGSKILYQAADQWKDFSNIVEEEINYINEVKATPMLLTPNITSNYFTVKNIEKPTEIYVYNVSSKNILQKVIQTNEQVSVTGWAKGIYLIKVNTTTAKLVVK